MTKLPTPVAHPQETSMERTQVTTVVLRGLKAGPIASADTSARPCLQQAHHLPDVQLPATYILRGTFQEAAHGSTHACTVITIVTAIVAAVLIMTMIVAQETHHLVLRARMAALAVIEEAKVEVAVELGVHVIQLTMIVMVTGTVVLHAVGAREKAMR